LDNSPKTFEITENSAIDSPVGAVTAEDNDADIFGSIRYSITSDTFGIDEIQGNISLISDIDREERNSYVVPITASDGGGLSTTVSITIDILDVNDNAPIFSNQILTGQTVEGSTGLQEDITIRVTDSDIGQNGEVTISINKDFPRFEITQNSNEIWKLNTIMSFTLERNMKCVGDIVVFEDYAIIANDNGIPRLLGEKLLTIHVQDINNHAPKIEISNIIKLRERNPVGKVVAQLEVTDEDPCSPNNLNLVTVVGEYKDYFRVENDQVILTNDQIDFETFGAQIAIEVLALDSGLPQLSSHTFVDLTLLDINDEQPEIHHCIIQEKIEENSFIGHQIGNCSVSDIDSDSELIYNLSCKCKKGFNEETCEVFSMTAISQSPVFVNFNITQNIDFEQISEISCTFEVSDSAADESFAQQTAATSIFLTVEDANDNIPVFSNASYHYQVPENVLVGQLVGTIRATDADVRDEIIYSISENEHLEIDSRTGEIKIKKTFDYE